MTKDPVQRSVWTNLGVPEGKVNKATWMPLNKAIVVGDEFGKVRVFDVVGKIKVDFAAHKKKINSFQWNKEKTLLITGSADCTSKVYDVSDFNHLKTYTTQVPDSAISPIKEHVVAGGRSDECDNNVNRAGKFETKFFLVFERSLGASRPLRSCEHTGDSPRWYRVSYFFIFFFGFAVFLNR